ncbi:MAG: SCP2 sterol-binding domain-containing protein [Methylophaga sp.]|nr:SCP2 sterol-binding domain-containing protein [Methylophaga sp.]
MSSLLKPLELALNTALGQDLETKAKLDQFEQRRIAVHIKDFNHTITMTVVDQQLVLSTNTEETADLTITANAMTLAKLGSDPDSLFSAEIDINGDVQFAKQLRDLLDGFDFDWEAQLAKVTGDSLAYPIAHGIRKFSGWAKNTHQAMQENTAEYLREEARILPDKSQINDYLTDIDKLRADCDRIEARIKRLQP